MQQVADAQRSKARAGTARTEILNRIKEATQIASSSTQLTTKTLTVDAKLVRFAQEIDGTLLTNDYNLSKVASVQKVPVLNINDLVHAVRPSYLPGDSIDLKNSREAKNQPGHRLPGGWHDGWLRKAVVMLAAKSGWW